MRYIGMAEEENKSKKHGHEKVEKKFNPITKKSRQFFFSNQLIKKKRKNILEMKSLNILAASAIRERENIVGR